MKEVLTAMDLYEDMLDQLCKDNNVKMDLVVNIVKGYKKWYKGLLDEQRGTKEEHMAIDAGIEELWTKDPMLEMTAGEFLTRVNVRKNDNNRSYFYVNKRKFQLERRSATTEEQ